MALATASPQTAVAEIADLLRERAAESERLRTMPPDLVDLVEGSGLFDLLMPRSLGGLELDPFAFFDTIEQLANADGSGGWTVMIGNSTAFFAWLEPSVARELIGGSRAAAANVMAPTGLAVPDGSGGYVVDGRWAFNSGCLHAAWFQNGVLITDDAGAPRMLPDGQVQRSFAYVRATDAEIVDTWDAAGLCGSGSHDVVMRSLRVPAEHVAMAGVDEPQHDGALWRLPILTLLGVMMVGFPLGVARRAVEEVTALAPGRRRGLTAVPLAVDPVAQVELGRCEGSLRAARAFALDAIGAAWATAQQGDIPTLAEQSNVQLALGHAMESALSVVDRCFRMAGASAVYRDHPLQRCSRDLHVAAQHIAFSPEIFRRHGETHFAPAG